MTDLVDIHLLNQTDGRFGMFILITSKLKTRNSIYNLKPQFGIHKQYKLKIPSNINSMCWALVYKSIFKKNYIL